eukprot:m.150815 g.150815  ORF g.150815 m.150815 type:complete len:317 (-) comp52810_c0_seq3:72-1022(-)
MQLLVASGVDVNAHNLIGVTPLHRTASFLSEKCTTLLLSAGARVNAQDSRGLTALHVACSKRNVRMVHLLLNAQADPTLASATGVTPLHLAAQTGNADVVGALLDAGASSNARDETGRTPVHEAAAYDSSLMRTRPVEALAAMLRADAAINLQDDDGRTALPLAVIKSNEGAVEKLLQYGARTDIPDQTGSVPSAWISKQHLTPALAAIARMIAEHEQRRESIGRNTKRALHSTESTTALHHDTVQPVEQGGLLSFGDDEFAAQEQQPTAEDMLADAEGPTSGASESDADPGLSNAVVPCSLFALDIDFDLPQDAL